MRSFFRLALAVVLLFSITSQVRGNTEQSPTKEPDILYIPTPQRVVNVMLELCDVKQTDMLYDLGCGDGRIVVTAAEKYGCKALGVDIDPARVRDSLANVKAASLENLVTIEQKDIFQLDLSEADIVTLYLLPELNVRLIPQLEMMKPGSRIVSHNYDMLGVEPDETVTITSRSYGEHIIYLWTVPLNKVAQPAANPGDDGDIDHLSIISPYVWPELLLLGIAAAVLAVLFWCLCKWLGVIKINVTIDRSRRQMNAEDA
ncbi:MAG: class I SAM-dependent methyltransferase [Planctomycetes bacterium]|nr:class I SAM-dependent methyltransferase [Planctomycetota bacterium]